MTTLNNPNLMRFFIRIKTLCLVIFAYTYISATEIRLAYSDLFPDDFQKYLYQSASEIEEDLNLDFTNFSAIESGSLPILEDFLSNRLDICIIALPENNDFPILPEDSVVKIPFCYKSSVVVVNAENPASEITINQLGMMFSTSSPSSNLLTWRDFGISSFSTSKIKAYAIKEANGISSDLFRYSVLREKQFNPSVNFEIEENLQRMILQDKAAIGIFPHSPSNPKLKALFVAQDDQSIPYGPSIDNMYYGDYPIRLPFYIVFNSKSSEKLYPILDILLSDKIARILEDNTFFPIPKVIRERLIIDLQLDNQ